MPAFPSWKQLWLLPSWARQAESSLSILPPHCEGALWIGTVHLGNPNFKGWLIKRQSKHLWWLTCTIYNVPPWAETTEVTTDPIKGKSLLNLPTVHWNELSIDELIHMSLVTCPGKKYYSDKRSKRLKGRIGRWYLEMSALVFCYYIKIPKAVNL